MAKKMKFSKWEIDLVKKTKSREATVDVKINIGGHSGKMQLSTLIEKLSAYPANCKVTVLEEDGYGVINLFLEEKIPLTPEELAYERDLEEQRIDRRVRNHSAYEMLIKRSLEKRALEMEEER